MFKVIRQPLFNMDGTGDGDQQPDKTFTQADIDRIVGERLAREKSKVADYDDLKELADIVKGFGYQGATAAEIKAQLKQELDSRNKQKELKALEDEAKTNGTSPELLAEINELKKKITELSQDKQEQQQAQEQKKAADEAWKQQVSEFQEKYQDVDMENLAKNEKFMKFLGKANPTVPLIEVYEDYIDLVGGAEAAAIAKIQSNADRTTSSGRAKGDPAGGTYGLTEGQQALAKKNDMSFKDYADLLKEIQ